MRRQEQPDPAQKPIEFVPIAQAKQTHWAKPASYAFLAGLSQAPLSDTELMLTSHHLPIAIDNIHDELRVVALTSAHFQRAPVVSKNGEWLRGYMPIAIRCLPFRLNPEHRNKGILEIATNLDGGANERRPISSVGGGLSSEVTQIETLLLRLDAGRHALRQAANTLLLADVLAPLQLARLSDPKSSPRRFFTVDRNRFARLTPRRAAILCAEASSRSISRWRASSRRDSWRRWLTSHAFLRLRRMNYRRTLLTPSRPLIKRMCKRIPVSSSPSSSSLPNGNRHDRHSVRP